MKSNTETPATIVITCGYFNPIHPGHIECFKMARQLGDELWVIVNNDRQAELKRKTPSFQDEQFRLSIVGAVSYVNNVILSKDTDEGVTLTLEETVANIKQKYPKAKIIFAKGGDRFASNIPEKIICDRHHIEIVDGLGAKTHSSRDYVTFKQNIVAQTHDKLETITSKESLALEVGMRPWGHYVVLEDRDHHKIKRLIVEPGHRLSLQSHTKRKEHWIVVQGTATVELDGAIFSLSEGETITIPIEAKHRISNMDTKTVEIVEVQYGTYTGEDDIIRYEDDYKRI